LMEHACGEEDVVVDARELRFIDVAGCRALVEVALKLAPPRRMILHGASAGLIRVMRLGGWLDAPQLEIHDLEAG
jgi:hypothetical protein